MDAVNRSNLELKRENERLKATHERSKVARTIEQLQRQIEVTEIHRKIERATQQAELDRTKAKIKANMMKQGSKRDMEHVLLKMALGNEKRDRLLENERRDRALENEKRDRLLSLETERRDRALENETRDRRHQVAELKSDMRMVQMQQQLEAQAYRTTHHTQPGTCTCDMNLQHAKTAVDAAPQREIELLQRIQLLELRAHDKETERGHLPVSISISPRETSQPVLVTPDSDKDKDQETRSRGHAASVAAPLSVLATHTTYSYSQPAATAPIQQQITATPPNKPKEQSAKQSSRQTTKTPAAVGRVPLPGNSRNHFFLSHCQATGGDQVNAIYLELQQLGFSCW
jgi:hypothetical protein